MNWYNISKAILDVLCECMFFIILFWIGVFSAFAYEWFCVQNWKAFAVAGVLALLPIVIIVLILIFTPKKKDTSREVDRIYMTNETYIPVYEDDQEDEGTCMEIFKLV